MIEPDHSDEATAGALRRIQPSKEAFRAFYDEQLAADAEELESYRLRWKKRARRSLIYMGLSLVFASPAIGVSNTIYKARTGEDHPLAAIGTLLGLACAVFFFVRWLRTRNTPDWPDELRRIFDRMAKFLSPQFTWLGGNPGFGGYGQELLMHGKVESAKVEVRRANPRSRETGKGGFTVTVTFPKLAEPRFPRLDVRPKTGGALDTVVSAMESVPGFLLKAKAARRRLPAVPFADASLAARFAAHSVEPERAARLLSREAFSDFPQSLTSDWVVLEFRGDSFRMRFLGGLGPQNGHFLTGPGINDAIGFDLLWAYCLILSDSIRLAGAFLQSARS